MPLKSDNANETKDPHEEFDKVCRLWRYIGLFPLTIKGPNNAKKYKLNIFFTIYSVLLLCGIVIFFYPEMAKDL